MSDWNEQVAPYPVLAPPDDYFHVENLYLLRGGNNVLWPHLEGEGQNCHSK